MNQYDELDRRILNAIATRAATILYNRHVCQEAERIANAQGRQAFRVIDGRLQALRKAGRIEHLTKAQSKSQSGWRIVGGEK